MFSGNHAIRQHAQRNLRYWIAIVCLSLTIFSGIVHASCMHIPTSSTSQISALQAPDTANNDGCPVTLGGGTHCGYCCGGAAVEANFQMLSVGSSIFTVASETMTELPSISTRFDTPPPKTLT
jgi:hypothetical protein